MKNLRIEKYQVGFAKQILGWVKNEDEFYQWCAGLIGTYPVSSETMEGYLEEKQQEGAFFPLLVYEDDALVGKEFLIGHFFLRYIDEEKTTVRIGFVILDPQKRGLGYGKALMLMAMEYAIEVLGAEKITLAVHAENIGAKKCYEDVGFLAQGDIQIFETEHKMMPCWEMEYAVPISSV